MTPVGSSARSSTLPSGNPLFKAPEIRVKVAPVSLPRNIPILLQLLTSAVFAAANKIFPRAATPEMFFQTRIPQFSDSNAQIWETQARLGLVEFSYRLR